MKRFVRVAVLVGSLFLAWGIGVASAQGTTPIRAPIADLAEADKVQQALEGFIRAYETGNVAQIRSQLDPAMIGYQRFIDGMIQDTNRLKQIRIHLLDTQTLVGPDVAVIQTRWEKRFLSATDLRPGIYSGRGQFLMHRGRDGWRVAAIGGDDPFASQSGVLAQLNLTFSGAAALSVDVEIVDPDLAGRRQLTGYDLSVNGVPCVMPRSLRETTPGRFFDASGCPASSGDVVVLRYMDVNPGSGRPPSLLTRRVIVP
jgi:hypothetical protein